MIVYTIYAMMMAIYSDESMFGRVHVWANPGASSEAAMPKLLIGAGIALILVGLLWLVGERLGLGRLPGDIVIDRGGVRIYIPIATSLVVSVILSLVFWLLARW
jgi:hypothetical protein